MGGDVENAFTATVDEGSRAAADSVSQTMTCSCGSNPADGRAIVSADVKGIPVTYLIEQARPASGANTVTFVCSDGTEQAFPLGYVIGRHAVCYEVNDEDLSASVGGNNQLWMTSTPASYFVRDVVEVLITAEEEAPATPGDGFDYPNSPNVGITGFERGVAARRKDARARSLARSGSQAGPSFPRRACLWRRVGHRAPGKAEYRGALAPGGMAYRAE